ncbi:phosphatidate phosphatase LPIN3 isoform X2 [Halyomorpha halys]|uniref:phosphatidate phosphatase LPIN3 isoform X2 n=1 Tax=Halyomorpha halys TaxID=286706 RepID=UPI0034D25D17
MELINLINVDFNSLPSRIGFNMNYLGKVINNCKYIYNEINAATLTGAIDVVVVEQPDGTYTCSPFHVRFGKMGVLRSKEKIVDIEINGEPVDIHMKLGESGEAFFVEEVEEEVIPPHLACSPIPPDSGEETADWNRLDDEDHGGGGVGPGGGETLKSIAEIVIDECSSPAQLETDPPTSSSTPKTFRAEKVDDEMVLGGSVEFRPIVGQNSSTSLSGLDTDFAKDDSPSADERLSVTNVPTSNNNKRKRRKKSTKKKQQQKRNSLPVEEASSEAIFQLDDIDSMQSPVIEKHVEKAKTKPLDLSSVQLDGHDIHFFSDTEITPGTRCCKESETILETGFHLLNGSHIAAFPREGCDFGPIQSDSEFETKRMEGEERTSAEEPSQSQWKWGELPTSSSLEDKKQESQKWMLQNMLGFMKKTKHMRHKNESDGGIYLSELNSDDPEMTALYFPSAHRQSTSGGIMDYREESREEDAESGNGPSLPQSPHSVEGAVCGPKSSDFEHSKGFPEDLAMSFCGPNPTPEQFEESQISYNDFIVNPQVIFDPKLVVRIEGKYYTWKSAAPILVSFFFFNKTLPQEVLSRISESEIDHDEKGVEARIDPKGKQSRKTYSSWFYWSRNNPQPKKYPNSSEAEVSSPTSLKEEDNKTPEISPVETIVKPDPPKRPDSISTDMPPIVDQPLDLSPQGRDDHLDSRLEEIPKEPETATPDFNSDKYRKTLRLTSAQIASLKLHPGANEIQFSVTTAYQGTSKCKCFLFCWRYDDKIVVSDIDGTITKSDVLGHILPIVGKDWAQSGVAKLFTKIKDNGYKLLYLSARAIGQSRLTREYLKSIKQEDLGLPEGPMLLNPTSLLNAFHTEVIEKKPEEFKISCLRDIQALFPTHIKPFYAGYGNKINDVWAYQAVGIPIFRIFTINHRGELKHELTETFQSTYIGQSNIVNELFPPMEEKMNSLPIDEGKESDHSNERLDEVLVDEI